MNRHLRRSALALFVSLLITCPVLGQSLIREQNIRAELGFLASDAMQGRGSGTNFERIAAEYIGSQFRQFGLEPAGDMDSAGNKSFVQRVPLESAKFVEPPTLTVTSSGNTQKWQFGRDFLVSFLRSSKTSGNLQVAGVEDEFTRGAVVAVKLPEDASQQQRQGLARKAFGSGVAAVVMIESETSRKAREAGEAKLPALTPRIAGPTDEGPFVAISLKKEYFDALAAMSGGTKVEFGGSTESSDTSATWNAVGVLKGSDPRAAAEVIMLSAH